VRLKASVAGTPRGGKVRSNPTPSKPRSFRPRRGVGARRWSGGGRGALSWPEQDRGSLQTEQAAERRGRERSKAASSDSRPSRRTRKREGDDGGSGEDRGNHRRTEGRKRTGSNPGNLTEREACERRWPPRGYWTPEGPGVAGLPEPAARLNLRDAGPAAERRPDQVQRGPYRSAGP